VASIGLNPIDTVDG